MYQNAQPLSIESWEKGDYRYGALVSPGNTSIEALAGSVGATVHEFEEDGLGLLNCFCVRLPSGRQVAFEGSVGVDRGVNLLVLFEDGACSRAEIDEALSVFEISASEVGWYSPEAR